MSHRLPITLSLEDGQKFNCHVLVEDDIVSSGWAFGGSQQPGVTELEVPPALHRKKFKDPDDEEYDYDLSDIEEIVLYAINDGGVKEDTVASSIHFELHGDVNSEPEPDSYYLVGNLVEHIFENTPEQALEKGAFLFSDEIQANAFAMANPGLSVHEIPPDDIDYELAVNSVSESFIGMANNKMKSDYEDGLDVNIVMKNASKYFPSTLPSKAVDSMVLAMVDEMQGTSLDKAIESHIPAAMDRSLLESAASKTLWLSRSTVQGRNVEDHIPNIPASANMVSENMNFEIEGNQMRGTMVFYQRPSSYFDRNDDEKPLVPVAFVSEDGTGDYVVLNHPSISKLQDKILSQRIGKENELGPDFKPMTPKINH